jgi:hypothetical protein
MKEANKTQRALSLALEALLVHEYELRKVGQSFKVEPAIKALEEALVADLSAPKQEQVAEKEIWIVTTPEEALDWLAQQHFDQCQEERPIQNWIRGMKAMLPKDVL